MFIVNAITAKLTSQFQLDQTPSANKHFSLFIHKQQFFSELPSSRRSAETNFWYSWVKTIYYDKFCLFRNLLTELLEKSDGRKY